MKKLTSEKFDRIIREHKENPTVDTMGTVFECLWVLAKTILKAVKFKGIEKAFNNRTGTYSRLVAFAYIKMERFDPDKGKAFNFFTTVMMCWLRQEYMTRHKYADLKAKYAESIKNTDNRGKKVYRPRERSL